MTTNHVHHYVITALFLCVSASASAQEEVYRMEMGGSVGGSFYLGDANYSMLYKNTQPMGGLVARYVFSPYLALKGNLTAAGIKGQLAETNGFPQTVNFSRTIYDMGIQMETNFWGYGIGQEYLNYKRLTPYISGGLGVTYASAPQGVLTMNIPIGIGMKYKLHPRWNVGFEVTTHFSLSDKLDRIEDPYRIKSGFLKNKDSYIFTGLSITYSFLPACVNCNKLED